MTQEHTTEGHEHDTETKESCECGGACEGGCNCSGSGCGDGCGCGEQENDGAAYLVHKAKMKLLLEKLKDQLEKTHGKDYEKLATMLIEFSAAEHKEDEALEKKRESLNEQFEKLFN